MSGYHWLLLRTGDLVIGNKSGDRHSWSALWPSGSLGSVNDSQVLDSKPIKQPVVATEEITKVVGEIQ